MARNRGIRLFSGASGASGAAVAAVLSLVPLVAHAQDPKPVSPTGKGIAGGILLGADIVMIPLGAAGVDTVWPYAVFPPLVAAGGAVGGYFLEKSSAPAEASLYMLAGGVGLFIPALVLTLNATAYDPAKDEEGGDEPTPAAQPSQPGAAPGVGSPTAPPAAPGGPHSRRHRVPRGLFDVSPQRMALGVPPVDVRPAYTDQELWQFGEKQISETHIAIVGGTF